MEFGRFSFARSGSLLVLALVLLCGSDFTAWAQQAPASAPETTAPVLPAAEPISQAAVASARSTDSAKNAPGGASARSVAASENSSSLRLGPGDLLEVGVYNVPELATKARVGNSGDVYLPLIDYVHVGDLTVEEAQALIEKRLGDGRFACGQRQPDGAAGAGSRGWGESYCENERSPHYPQGSDRDDGNESSAEEDAGSESSRCELTG